MSTPLDDNEISDDESSEENYEFSSSEELENEACSVAELCQLVREKEGNANAILVNVLKSPNTSGQKNISRRRLDLESLPSEYVDPEEDSDPDVNAFVENCNKTKKRKLKADTTAWKRQQNQKRRVLGESFEGFQRKRDESGKMKFSAGIPREESKMGERCTSSYCANLKVRHCEKFSKEARQEIFSNFWTNLGTWQLKKTHVCSLVTMTSAVRKSKTKKSKRQETFQYSLYLDGAMVRVCAKMFANTLGLNDQRIRSWVRSSKGGIPERSPKAQSRGLTPEMKFAETYVDMLPKLPSHYGRARSSKLYLEPVINSKNELFNLYKNYCAAAGQKAVSKPSLKKILREKNICIWLPKKDQCDLCVGYESKNVSEAAFMQHQKKKELARMEKNLDKSMALEGKQHVLAMDLQAVKLAPSLQANALYYKTKLRVHNFTIYDLRTKHAKCYLWDESEGDLSSSTFATCVRDFLNGYTDTLPIVIYSDGCTYQNRNVMLANAILDHAIEKKKVVLQKFLERGHTQMEVDSVHAAIEAELKRKTIFLPMEYEKICQNARIANPYEVSYLHHSYFRDFTKKENHRYKSIRPDKFKHEKKKVTDIRQICYSPDGSISYKLQHDEPNWTTLPHKSFEMTPTKFQLLFNERRPISARKFQDLQDLLHVIPEEHHYFYTGLPREN